LGGKTQKHTKNDRQFFEAIRSVKIFSAKKQLGFWFKTLTLKEKNML
jgi:hypothetical protein